MSRRVSKSRPVRVAEAFAGAEAAGHHAASEADTEHLLGRILGRLERRAGSVHLARLLRYRGDIMAALGKLPDRMHLVANQTQLILELAEDYRTGVYREVPWRSMAVLAAIAVYLFSPLDLIPDVLGGFGLLDDMLLIGFGARLMRKDLDAYCAFKGYDPAHYFGAG